VSKDPEHFLCCLLPERKPSFLEPANPAKLSRTQRQFIIDVGSGYDVSRVNAGGAQRRMAWRLHLAGLIRNRRVWLGAAYSDYGIELTEAGHALWRTMKSRRRTS
jgi:hypothetical protein